MSQVSIPQAIGQLWSLKSSAQALGSGAVAGAAALAYSLALPFQVVLSAPLFTIACYSAWYICNNIKWRKQEAAIEHKIRMADLSQRLSKDKIITLVPTRTAGADPRIAESEAVPTAARAL